MFDHEGVKTTKVMRSLSILFSQVKSKNLVTKKYEVKGPNMHDPINLWLLKIYSTIFVGAFLM